MFEDDVIARFRNGADGKTVWDGGSGREFGERFHMREARERTGTANMDWQESRCVQVCTSLTPVGVISGRLGRRLAESDRWTV